jgi:NADP-dependent 3-hydroxy acid dehydrogenase YdfG
MASLTGKTALVTGASSGIGKAIALTLAREGASVFLTGRDPARTAQTVKEIEAAGGAATGEAFDVTDIERLQGFVAKAAKAGDGFHVMVNAAGLEFPGALLKGDPKRWKEVLDTNVVAVAVGSQAAVQAMRETKSEGHIVTISSIASKRAEGGFYAASKIAVNFIMATLREELENDPIRAVTILPGAVGTNFARNFPAEFVNGFAKAAGLNTEVQQGDVLPDEVFATLNERAAAILAKPQDIADAVLYAIQQPITLNIAEITVRPGKGLALPRD